MAIFELFRRERPGAPPREELDINLETLAVPPVSLEEQPVSIPSEESVVLITEQESLEQRAEDREQLADILRGLDSVYRQSDVLPEEIPQAVLAAAEEIIQLHSYANIPFANMYERLLDILEEGKVVGMVKILEREAKRLEREAAEIKKRVG